MREDVDTARASSLEISIRSTADIADALQASLQHGGLLMHEHERHPVIRLFVSNADACAWLSGPTASGTT